MPEFIMSWFTPSDSDNQSGAQYNAAYNAAQQAAAARNAPPRELDRSGPAEKQRIRGPRPKTRTKYAGTELAKSEADTAKKMLLGQ